MNKNYLIIGLIILALVVIGVIAARSVEKPAIVEERVPVVEEGVMVPRIEVSDQVVAEGSVVVDRVYAQTNAWIIVYRMAEDGVPETDVYIGAAAIGPGGSRGVAVELTEEVAEGEVLVMILHEDTGVIGEYEFGAEAPNIDQPVLVDGEVVAVAFTVIGPGAVAEPGVGAEAGAEVPTPPVGQ